MSTKFSLNSNRVLVTGGFGYVGSRLTPLLLSRGYQVRVLDLLLYGDEGLTSLKKSPDFPEWEDRFEFVCGDLRDASVVSDALKECSAVVHLGAISNDPTGQVDEVLTRQVNFDAMGMLLALSREAGAGRFINASSSSVFGARTESEINEKLEPEPLTHYSKYKMLSEWLVVAAAGPGFCATNIRPATICGVSPRQRFDLTVNKLTADAVTKRRITVHGGSQRRPNVGMTDIVALYHDLLAVDADKICGKTFNFGFENQKVIEIAQIVQEELSDLNVEIEVTDAVDLRDYHIDSRKILNEIGYRPVSSIRQEVRELRHALDSGLFPDPDSPAYYNMQSMQMERNAGCYQWFSR